MHKSAEVMDVGFFSNLKVPYPIASTSFASRNVNSQQVFFLVMAPATSLERLLSIMRQLISGLG